jgi:hypothetical protein
MKRKGPHGFLIAVSNRVAFGLQSQTRNGHQAVDRQTIDFEQNPIW